MAQFQEKVAVVTGASRGIGKAIALELSARGAAVIINCKCEADTIEADEVVQQIVDKGGQAQVITADVTDEEQVDMLFKSAAQAFGKVDILVNNAGITRDNVIMMMKADDFDAVIQTNLRSTWLCSKAAVRSMMRKRYGRIINVSSVSGMMGQAGQTNYSASKAGIIGLTKALAREVASRNITVNAVAPGFVLTDLTKDLPEDLTARLNDFIPLGRWGTVEEVALAVAFLASDDARYITGHILNVDGGMAM
jgi:3-oxoacyl-[acyl-carrier protein] reductase